MHKNIINCLLSVIVVTFCTLELTSQNRSWDYKGDWSCIKITEPYVYVRVVRVGPEEAGLYGVERANGEVLIEPKYDYIAYFEPNGLSVVQKQDKFGYVNWLGDEITRIDYDRPRWWADDWRFVKNRSVVRRGNKFGYIDKNGKEVIPLKYTFAIPFNNYGTSVVYTGDAEVDHSFDGRPKSWENLKAGVIDTSGNYIIRPDQYVSIWKGINDHWVCFNPDKKISFLNQQGKLLLASDFSNAEIVSHRYYLVSKIIGHKYSNYGVINKDFSVIIPPSYDMIHPYEFSDGKIIYMSRIKFSDKYVIYFINENGSLLTSKKYYFKNMAGGFINSIYDGMWGNRMQVVVDEDDKCGYIDINGFETIPCQYDAAENFSRYSGLAVVSDKSKKFGAINKEGKLIIPFKYDRIYNVWRDGDNLQVVSYIDGNPVSVYLDCNGNEL